MKDDPDLGGWPLRIVVALFFVWMVWRALWGQE